MHVACLHTANSNIAVFEDASAGLGVRTSHLVRADLLAAAEAAGGLTDEIRQATVLALIELSRDADAVILTCSTLGDAVDSLQDRLIPVLRADAALADEAVNGGGRLIVLCTVETTLQTTTTLFSKAASRRQAPPAIEVRLIPGAWDEFRAGRLNNYLALIASAADDAFTDGATAVALAQASMTPASEMCRRGSPLTSPSAAFAQARRRAKNREDV